MFRIKKTGIVDAVIVYIKYLAKGVYLETKGKGSWIQARDLN
jgi:hypothetical protein